MNINGDAYCKGLDLYTIPDDSRWHVLKENALHNFSKWYLLDFGGDTFALYNLDTQSSQLISREQGGELIVKLGLIPDEYKSGLQGCTEWVQKNLNGQNSPLNNVMKSFPRRVGSLFD